MKATTQVNMATIHQNLRIAIDLDTSPLQGHLLGVDLDSFGWLMDLDAKGN